MHRIDSVLATDVCEFVSVDLLDTMVSHAKTDKPIDMPFWPAWSRVGPRNHVLYVGLAPPTGRGTLWDILGHGRSLYTMLVARGISAVAVRYR